jgi:SpoU rRNA methylase family enzyme
MKNLELIRVDTAQRIYPNLKARIIALIEQYGATAQEIDQVYNHILMEMLMQ